MIKGYNDTDQMDTFVSDEKFLHTLVCRIDVQGEINMQVEKFFKNIKRAGQNRRTGGKLSGKSINMQGENFLENGVKL